MNEKFPLSKDIRLVFKHDPPGQWLPKLPPGCIKLSAGYPAPELTPSQELKEAVARLLDEEGDAPLQYIGSPRTPELKQYIRKRMAVRGMETAADELLVTAGACQAIDLIARILLDEEALVVIESPTYMEALEIFQNYTEQYLSIPIDENGLDTDRLEQVLLDRQRAGQALPRVLYTIPSFQNPTGTVMSLDRRKHLLRLAGDFDFLIIEDDAYGELAFEERPVPLKAMDADNRVIYVGSLSKVVAPGMRIGWVAGAEELITLLSWFKKDLGHPFGEATMAAFLEKTNFADRVDRLSGAYKEKSEAMTAALKKHFPESASWYTPDGGYFVWVHVPGIDAAALLQTALDAGVSYVPGKYFFLDEREGREFLRLSFSYVNETEIEEGIRLLGKVVSELK
ncbi:aminotransferase-like domain-containing protein [Planococcus lenghuensis]|uniref:Aminotransferase n=1 Tax=Planococcus lenghuensis TaxID=2213202 RepID=A0A1Q2KWX4_9BACL|nr:PLP-dependent aminotransferase family protein [Planococcus lenghuensis]AQQ52317.1 aminotransferase [Planococcus lenghuensis]